MSKTVWNRSFLGLALITSLMLLGWIAGLNAGAQTSTSGAWTANIDSKESSKININFGRRADKGQQAAFDIVSLMSSDYDRAEVLLAFVGAQGIDSANRRAFVSAAERIGSSHDQNRVLAALVRSERR